MKKGIALLLALCLPLCGVALAEEPEASPAVELCLAENPSTGYAWVLTPSVANVLTLIDDSFASDPDDEPLMGAGGVRCFAFAATGEGEVTLTFDLLPPGDAQPAETRTFTYTVDADLTAALQDTNVSTSAVELEITGGTGYEWSVSQEGRGQVCCADHTLTYDSIQPGASGVEKWTFIAVEPGEVRLTFTLARPWEEGVAPDAVMELRYNIAEDGTLSVLEE